MQYPAEAIALVFTLGGIVIFCIFPRFESCLHQMDGLSVFDCKHFYCKVYALDLCRNISQDL